MTLEQLLQHCLNNNVPARIQPVKGRNGSAVEFYVHPDGADGDTLDYAVRGDEVTPLGRAAGG